jgi:2-polyprenyl-6-methoxyphenol hydroxylase-like FAD-dependent oxidoreductase
VVGGSLAGLFAANMLRTIGWDVTVFERSSGGLAGRGAGLGTREELFAVMRRIGIRLDESIGAQVLSRIALDRNGTILHELPIAAVSTAWDRIYGALRGALPDECYRPGMTFLELHQDARKVTARFADGSQHDGDLLVAADGINSIVRRQLLPEVTPRYAGYVAWRAVTSARDISSELASMATQHMVFHFLRDELAFSVPMAAGYDEDHLRSHFVWFRPADRETDLPGLFSDATGRCHGESIPAPLIRAELIKELKANADVLLPWQLATLLHKSAQPILQAIYDLESPQLAFGRVVLVGDAAFVARPHVGTGVTKAALDAHELADALTESADLSAAMARYDQERRAFGTWLVARGRHLGNHLVAGAQYRGSDRPQARRPLEILMREVGSAGVIDGEPIAPSPIEIATTKP